MSVLARLLVPKGMYLGLGRPQLSLVEDLLMTHDVYRFLRRRYCRGALRTRAEASVWRKIMPIDPSNRRRS